MYWLGSRFPYVNRKVEGEKGPAQDMPGSHYIQSDSPGGRTGADAD